MSMGAVLNVGFENVEALINKAVYCKYSSSVLRNFCSGLSRTLLRVALSQITLLTTILR